MIRIICKDVDTSMAQHTGSPHTKTTLRTFDVDYPELEEWLTRNRGSNDREVIGAEVIKIGERVRIQE